MPNLPEDILDRIKQIERRLQRTATAATTSAAVQPWQNLPLAAGFTPESATPPQYRIQGPMVMVRGDATVTGGLSEGVVAATLPVGAKPLVAQAFAVATPNTTASWMTVDTRGQLIYHGANASWVAFNFIVALG